MVSHVDDDHIQGILDLTREELVEKQAHRPLLLNVLSFWHNSFDAIIGHEPTELTASFQDHFGSAALSGGELSDHAICAVIQSSPGQLLARCPIESAVDANAAAAGMTAEMVGALDASGRRQHA